MTEPERPIAADEARRQRRIGARQALSLAIALAAVVYFILLIVQNRRRVPVDYVFGTSHARLIWLIVVCTLLGGAVGFFLGRPSSRSRRQRPGGPPGEDGEGPRRA